VSRDESKRGAEWLLSRFDQLAAGWGARISERQLLTPEEAGGESFDRDLFVFLVRDHRDERHRELFPSEDLEDLEGTPGLRAALEARLRLMLKRITRTAFLCHSSLDKPLARRLAEDLRKAGVDVWFDEWEIAPGESLRRKIDAGIERASYFLALLTSNSLQSEWAQTELDAGMVQRIRGESKLIPIVAGISDRDVPPTLAAVLWVRLDDYDAGLRRLIDACHEVSTKPPLGRPPAWASERPLENSDLSPHAQRIAVLLSERAILGIEGEVFLDIDDLQSELGLDLDQIAVAVDELQDRGMVKVLGDANSAIGIRMISPGVALFFETDPALKGWNPVEDAHALAVAAVNTGQNGFTLDEMTKQLGWEPRRINSAAYVLDVYGYAKGLRVHDPIYAFGTMLITPKTRRFAQQA
jgi:TIR domain